MVCAVCLYILFRISFLLKRFNSHICIHHSIISRVIKYVFSLWRNQMEKFCALVVLREGNSPVTVEFPSQRPMRQGFGLFDLRLNKRLSKPSSRWWLDTPSRSVWNHCNVVFSMIYTIKCARKKYCKNACVFMYLFYIAQYTYMVTTTAFVSGNHWQ